MGAVQRIVLMSCLAFAAMSSIGCAPPPQQLPVVMSVGDSADIRWNDPHGQLRGEVPWVLRTDVMGPDTFLVVETPGGDFCAETVTFRVLAAGVTEYEVTLVSDLHGKVSWRVVSPGNKQLKLFTCSPRPADEPRRECLHGGIPRPLLGDLVGAISAELATGVTVDDVQAVRFESDFPCTVGFDSGEASRSTAPPAISTGAGSEVP